MILCVSLDNTYITFGIFDDYKLIHSFCLSSEKQNTVDEYVLAIKNMLALKNIDEHMLEGAIISSVVPLLTDTVSGAVKYLIGKSPIILGAGVKTSLDIKVDNPAEVGGDIIAGCVGAVKTYGAPCIVYNFVSATTISVINKNNQLTDVYIAPGIGPSAESLAASSSALPDAQISLPKTLSGKNTRDSMRCGIMYSQAFIIDGFAKRLTDALGTEPTLVVSGLYAGDIALLCESKVKCDNTLILRGLKYIYDKNAK